MMSMGWTSTEKLFLLFEDGQFVIFSNMGELCSLNKLFKTALSDIVVHANTTEDGFIAITKANHM